MKNKKTIVLIALMFLINGIAITGWFYLFFAILDEKEVVNEIRGKFVSVEKKASDSQSLQKLMDNIQGERERIDSIFINKESIINFIDQLEILRDEAGVSLEFNSITIDEKGRSGPNFRFKLSGEFNEIFNYLALLENVPYQISLKKANIQSTKGNWTANIDIILTSFIYEEV